MNRLDGTIEQRLERLERLDGETQARLRTIERLLKLVGPDPILGRRKAPKPESPSDEHQGSRRVETKTGDSRLWHWPEW